MKTIITKGRAAAGLINAAAIFGLASVTAHANATLNGVNSVADTILAFMTGPIATAIGAIAIAFVGYRWFSGRMELGRAMATVAGIVLVIGSVQIVNFIRTGAQLQNGYTPTTSNTAPAAVETMLASSDSLLAREFGAAVI